MADTNSRIQGYVGGRFWERNTLAEQRQEQNPHSLSASKQATLFWFRWAKTEGDHMRSAIFYTETYQRIESRILDLLNSQDRFLSAQTINSTRATGDAV